MKIVLLIANGYGMGGTIRTVFTLAQGLAERHDVEIVSLVQHREEPFFPVPPGVTVRTLAPTPNWRGRPRQPLPERVLENLPGLFLPRSEAGSDRGVFNVRTQWALRSFLATTDADVVVGTRPGLNLLLARWAPPRLLTIGQEHVFLGNHSEDKRTRIERWYPRLDGMTVLTEADRRSYTDLLPADPGWIATMPNPLPPGPRPCSSLDNPVIAAAGRLTPIKQFDKLIRAFAVVVRHHPEWRLRIYGGGPREKQLRALIAESGLYNNVALMGRTTDMLGELAKASILGVSSRAEGFGMTIVEAFSVGLPVVSFDCPHGPREIISHGHDGLLAAPRDVGALAAGLMRLVADREERHRMGAAALRTVQRYDLDAVTRRWEDFLCERRAAKERIPPALRG